MRYHQLYPPVFHLPYRYVSIPCFLSPAFWYVSDAIVATADLRHHLRINQQRIQQRSPRWHPLRLASEHPTWSELRFLMNLFSHIDLCSVYFLGAYQQTNWGNSTFHLHTWVLGYGFFDSCPCIKMLYYEFSGTYQTAIRATLEEPYKGQRMEIIEGLSHEYCSHTILCIF